MCALHTPGKSDFKGIRLCCHQKTKSAREFWRAKRTLNTKLVCGSWPTAPWPHVWSDGGGTRGIHRAVQQQSLQLWGWRVSLWRGKSVGSREIIRGALQCTHVTGSCSTGCSSLRNQGLGAQIYRPQRFEDLISPDNVTNVVLIIPCLRKTWVLY